MQHQNSHNKLKGLFRFARDLQGFRLKEFRFVCFFFPSVVYPGHRNALCQIGQQAKEPHLNTGLG